METTEIYELVPMSNRKSFYGKAKVICVNGWKYLRSYDTIVGAKDPNGGEHRYSDWDSMTTRSHAKSFFKDGFWKLPIEEKPTINITL